MYRILIVEDTPSEADLLKGCLSRYAAERNVGFSITVLPSALEFINTQRTTDLVLMDIDMPGINGMEAAEILRTYDTQTPLIFVTNLAQYAVRGYSVDALDFVVKPIEYLDFSMRMDRALKVMRRNSAESIALPTSDGLRVTPQSDILYVDLIKHDLQYHLADGSTLKERGSLRSAAERLDQAKFIKATSGCLFNMGHVRAIKRASVVLTDGTELFFSRSQRRPALEMLANYMGRSI